MNIDANRAIDTVAKFGPGHFMACVLLVFLAFGGYIIHEDLAAVSAEVRELANEIEASTDGASDRGAAFRQAQERQQRLLVAVCYGLSNGDPDSRRRCEEAAR